jgi:hypothetical protein
MRAIQHPDARATAGMAIDTLPTNFHLLTAGTPSAPDQTWVGECSDETSKFRTSTIQLALK